MPTVIYVGKNQIGMGTGRNWGFRGKEMRLFMIVVLVEQLEAKLLPVIMLRLI